MVCVYAAVSVFDYQLFICTSGGVILNSVFLFVIWKTLVLTFTDANILPLTRCDA